MDFTLALLALIAFLSILVSCAGTSKHALPNSTSSAVTGFIQAINCGDAGALERLMTIDHVFIDSLGNRVEGRTSMLAGWKGYFELVPDYVITVDRMMVDGDVVLLCGKAGGTFAPDGKRTADRRWEVPAAWRAVVRDGAVREWQVYADNKRMYELMAKAGGG